MILLNNVGLESVAPVMVEDIHISPVQRNVVSRDRPLAPGAHFVRTTDGVRTVAIVFALLTNDNTTRQSQISAINAWARAETPLPLVLPGLEDRHLMVVATSLPEPSMRQWFESKLRIVFTAFDPYFISNTEKSVACGTAFTAGGNVPPLVEIRRTLSSAVTNQSYSDGTHTMTFTRIPKGSMVIDLQAQTARVGAASFMQYYDVTGSFPVPKTG